MNQTRVQIREAIRWQLKDFDATDETWEQQEVDAAIDRVLRDINRREPKLNHTILAIQDLTKAIDISGLTGLLSVISVEYPFGDVPVVLRDFRVLGDTLLMEISDIVDTAETTLTGTVTFTNGGFTVSGSGTTFTTEIAAGYFIKKSSGSYWNRVAYVSSDTSITLDTPFSGTTGADTVSLTKIRSEDDCAMVNWTSEYTLVEETASTLPQKMEDLIAIGATAFLLAAQATKYANEVPIAAGAMGNYVAQADRAMAMYQSQLAGIGRIEDGIVANYPIT